MNLKQSMFLNAVLIVAFASFVCGLLHEFSRQEAEVTRAMIIKCQEGWQFYCKKPEVQEALRRPELYTLRLDN